MHARPDAPLADDALAELALAADPHTELDDDAVPLSEMLGGGSRQPLPLWYMPAPSTGIGPLRGWRRLIVALVIAAFLTITAFGLCNTYGQLHG